MVDKEVNKMDSHDDGSFFLRRFVSYVKLATAYVAFNLKAQLEYRTAFWSQLASMAINDAFWLTFWVFFFKRFNVLGSWNQTDLITMWAVVTAGFGIAHSTAGNALHIATVILKGQLDTWLLYPRAVLPHLLFGKMNVSAWGDTLFGVFVFLFLVHPTPAQFLLFLLLILNVAIAFVGFGVLAGSLGFFLGNGEGLSEQLRFALVSFSSNPPSIFDGASKVMLYTLVPAGFCSYLPVEALKQNSLELALLSFGGSMLILGAGIFVFYYGLSRYESGNLMEMRG
jgi:ABC-2 type transport system permease protein